MMNPITICPLCGSPNIQHVKKDFVDEFQGQTYLVPMLEFYECPDCGEKL
jgi:YgiT-type zinc finger domain-containing protein